MKSTETRCSDEFFVLDADRCLIDTDAAVGRLVNILGDNGEAVLAAKLLQTVERRKSASSVHEVLENALGIEKTLDFYAQYAQTDETERRQLRGKGADDLIGFLDDIEVSKGILTYGDKPWQLTKIQGAGFDEIPTMVTAEKKKGKTIASWRQNYGKYWVPEELLGSSNKEINGVIGSKVLFATIVFADDKIESFDGFPLEDAVGYLVNQKVSRSPAENISIARDLGEVREIEESRLSI